MSKGSLKVLALPCDNGGCGHYRIRQPFEMIKAHTPHDAHVVDSAADNMIAVTKAMSVADVVVVRQGGEEGMRRLKTFPEFKHIKWVLDIDDNVELISPYSQHYKEYGTEEHFDQGLKQWIWKNGENGFELSANRARLVSLLKGMAEADMVTTTTPILAEYAKQYNPTVRVLPNCIDREKWWPFMDARRRKLRVGWSGGVSHYEDWYEIREPLNRMLREGNMTLVMVGSHYQGLIDPENRKHVEVWPWVPFEAHSYRMMCLGLDIALIPLADLPFNRFKSSIKWYEFAAMGVPCLVANREPYASEIKGLASSYNGPHEFAGKLRQLLEGPKTRKILADDALSWVREHRDAKTNAHLWTDAYASLL